MVETMTQSRTPDLMPILSRGKHRNPRKGGCFMELASYLAWERWSDHPKCSHPLLAALARDVNDHVSDAHRVYLAPLIPDVIGLTSEDPRVHAWIAREAALTALPIVAAEKQGVAAAAVLRCELHLAEIEGRDRTYVSPASRAALSQVPHAQRWAQQFSATLRGPVENFALRSAPAIVHTSVSAISRACVPDPGGVLVELLTETIGNCKTWFQTEVVAVTDDQWAEVCALTR
jgi:hypothetical protein